MEIEENENVLQDAKEMLKRELRSGSCIFTSFGSQTSHTKSRISI